METAGVEPASRNIDTYASTSIVAVFLVRRHVSPATGLFAASLIDLFLRPQTGGNRRSPLRVSPSTYHMGDGGWNRKSAIKQLVRSYCFLCQLIGFGVLTRPTPSTRNVSTNYPCRIQNVPKLRKINQVLSALR